MCVFVCVACMQGGIFVLTSLNLICRNVAFKAEIHLQIEEGQDEGKQTETKD